MTTSLLPYTRGQEISEIAPALGTAVAGDIHVIYEDALTKQELITGLERIKAAVLEKPFPRV
jgi:hypothetical protein